MDRATKAAIVIFVVVLILMLALAAYGYFGGAWDSAPS
jgi:ABC-type cobalt transport system substrate-binding protein